ncbi:MAG TPA: hypothetical protein VFC67_18200 [Prolixibacteraceae bacterium]|nr:hypothetical protein [Prolixibacteraceae bacterium]
MENIENLPLKMERNAQVISVLSRNAEVWNKVSKFQAAIDRLISNQEKLVELQTILNKDVKAIEKTKNERRKELEDRTMTLVRIMQVFAHDKKKGKLQRKLFHLTYEFVENCMDLELVDISKEIWLIANKFGGYAITFVTKIKAALNPENGKATSKFEKEFGLNPEMIKNLEEAILSFIKAMIPYNEEMARKSKVAIKMKEINKKTKKLLANKIDRFVLMFENENPGFYKEYHDLREDHYYKHVKETINQETDFNELLVDDKLVIQAEPKVKSIVNQLPKKRG